MSRQNYFIWSDLKKEETESEVDLSCPISETKKIYIPKKIDGRNKFERNRKKIRTNLNLSKVQLGASYLTFPKVKSPDQFQGEVKK